jgi:hypothetical protein
MTDMMCEVATPPTPGIAAMVARPTFIRSPATRGLVPTGVYVTELAQLDPIHVLPFCPDCGADHEWTPAEATFGGL